MKKESGAGDYEMDFEAESLHSDHSEVLVSGDQGITHTVSPNIENTEQRSNIEEMTPKSINYEGEKAHNMRLSIEVPTLNNLKYEGDFYIEYELNLDEKNRFKFKSYPAVYCEKGRENKLEKTFGSYELQITRKELYPILTGLTLSINIIEKMGGGNETYGCITMDMGEILKAPLKRREESTVRSIKRMLPIYKNRDISTKIGECGIQIYLEDMGVMNERAGIYKGNLIGDDEKRRKDVEWELEIWKREQQTVFKDYLKQKEIEHLREISMNSEIKEGERERMFVQLTSELNSMETSLRKKVIEVQKRENKIISIEDELKLKVKEVARQMAFKEEEVINMKKRANDEKKEQTKREKDLVCERDKLKELVEETADKYKILKSEYEESPIAILRNEIATKNIEINEIRKESEHSEQLKEQYKNRYEQIKSELIRIRQEQEMEKENNIIRQNNEINKLKGELEERNKLRDEKQELHKLKNEIERYGGKYGMGGNTNYQEPIPQNPMGSIKSNKSINQREGNIYNTKGSGGDMDWSVGESTGSNVFLHNYAPPPNKYIQPNTGAVLKGGGAKGESQLDRIINERKELLDSGLYREDDQLIIEFNAQIAHLTNL